jgi:hypothetical protein
MDHFELILFSTDPLFIRVGVMAGLDSVIVDWEHEGKEARQAGADTQINHDTLEDLRAVRACTRARVLCRLNGYGPTTKREVEQAVEAGGDELLLPMVRTVKEVETTLRQVDGRCQLGILIETLPAVTLASDLARLPMSRVYVGLNDLALARQSCNIFTAVADGTVERVRQHFTIPFGFGGLTLPECGFPVPCRLLIGEMARLGCSFSFLRRSFHRDIHGRDLAVEIPRLRQALADAALRPPEAVARDRADLETAIRNWPGTERHKVHV